jgi:phosphatidylglycerophosphate synthase
VNSSPPALKRLRRQWAYAAAAAGGCIAGVAGLLAIRFTPNAAVRWAVPSLIVLTWFFFRMQRALVRNHAPGDSELRPSLGAANAITVTRAALAATLAGFIIPPPPAGAEALWEWLPGLVYMTAVVLDGADGYVARRSADVTGLGEFLDTQVDAFALLLASSLLVANAKAPLPYLWVGLGYYILQAAIALRRAAGKTIGAVTPRPDARWVAGCEMAYAALALLPVFKPEATRPAAWVMTLALGISLGRDWGIVCGGAGHAGETPSPARNRFWRGIDRGLPLALRTATAGGLMLALGASPAGALDGVPLPVGKTAAACAALCVLGVAARAAAMLLSLLFALWLIPASPSGAACFSLMAAIGLVLTGAGRPRIWQPEDRLLMRKRGDRISP